MSFRLTKTGDSILVAVEGTLGVGNRQQLKLLVLDEMARGGRHVRVDFRDTSYIDSSGLGVLVSLAKKLREQGGELRIANLSPDLTTLFELTKLDTLFRLEHDDNDGTAGRTAPLRPPSPGPLRAHENPPSPGAEH
jgi:anti-anti-sigma factor